MRHLGARFGLALVILLVGMMILIELLAHVALPVFRLVVGVAITVIGARMVLEIWNRRKLEPAAGEAVMANLNFSQQGVLDRDERFDVVLGSGAIDLTKLVEPMRDVTVTIDTLFGRAIVKLPATVAYDVEGSATFGQVRLPDRSATATGTIEYTPRRDHPPHLHLRLHAVFGACQVIEATAAA